MDLKVLSRRSFLQKAALLAGASTLAACQPQVVKETVVIEKEVEKVVKETVIVEKPAEGGSSVTDEGTIEMWMWETQPRWLQVEATSGLNEQFPNVTFKWTALPYGDLHQKALTSMAAGMAEGVPSIIRTGANYYRPFVNAGALMEVTDEVMPYKDDIMPFAWQTAFVDGKSYQLMDDTGVCLLGYRWDIFEKAGLPSEPEAVAELLKTYDDLLTVGQEIKKATGALLFNMTPGAGVFNQLMLQDSTGYFDENGEVIFDSDYHVGAAEFTKKLWDSELVSNYEQGPQYWQAVKDGKAAVMFYPNWQDFVVIDQAPETKGLWRATKLPAMTTGGRRATTANGCQLCIPSIKPIEEQQLALKVGLYMKFTTQATVAHMKTFSGAYVSYIPGLEAMRYEPSPVLDGQFVYSLYLDTARDENVLPWYRSTTGFYTNAEEAVGNALFRVLKEGIPAQDALAEAADLIRDLQQSKGQK
jgi:ABC-type glycerol-3-phosphate transport system substrate-binding protein